MALPRRNDVGLEDRVLALEAAVARLSARGGARDEADRQLLLTMAESSRALPFRALDLLQRADFESDLHAALLAADLVSTKEIGKWLARMAEHSIDGVCIERGRLVRGAMRWRVSQVCEG